MTSLIKNKNGQYSVTIPKEVVEATGWKKGEQLYIGKNKGEESIFIEKIKEVKK